MGPIDLTLHLFGFAAPAVFVALVVTSGARWLRLAPQPLRWWAQGAINFTAGVVALGAGLWHFGVDGKMATYAALVAAVATSQWLSSRGWKR
jgi:nitrate reductase gamma subunit